MNVGDKVRIVNCNQCPKIIGKTGIVTKLNTEGQDECCLDVSSIEIKFGRGRPQKNRPSEFTCDDVILIKG